MDIDSNLALRARYGDTQAFSELYSSVWHDLYRYAYYVLGNKQDAEDAVQECALEAYKSLRSLKDENAFKGWIFSILYRACKRKIKYIIKHKSDSYEPDNPDKLNNSDEDMSEAILLMDSVGKLNPEDRLILMLSVVCGYKGSEIAKYLNKPAGTVRSRLSRALNALKAYMKE